MDHEGKNVYMTHIERMLFLVAAVFFICALGLRASADCGVRAPVESDRGTPTLGRQISQPTQSVVEGSSENWPIDPAGERSEKGLIKVARSILLGPVTAALIGLIIAGILWKNSISDRIPQTAMKWIDRAILALAIVEVVAVVGLCVLRVVTPAGWDFPFFYTAGRAAVEGYLFYDPSALTSVFEQVTLETPVPADWLQEVGYPYLPSSALLLMPLGIMSYRWALSVHYLVHGLFLIGGVLMANRLAPVRRGWMGRVETMVLFLSFAPVLKVFNGAQITFGALFFLILALLEIRSRPLRAGIFLAFGFLFKHQLLIVAAFSMALKKTRAFAIFTITALTTLALSLIVFGIEKCSGFFDFGASTRIPYIGFDRVNHSLCSTLIRISKHREPLEGVVDLLLYPPFFLTAGILTLITVTICIKGGWTRSQLLLKCSLVIALMMMAYPHTLYGTLPLVLPVFLVLFSFRNLLPVPSWLVSLFIGAQYSIVLLRPYAFWMLLFTWIATAAAVVLAHRTELEANGTSPNRQGQIQAP